MPTIKTWIGTIISSNIKLKLYTPEINSTMAIILIWSIITIYSSLALDILKNLNITENEEKKYQTKMIEMLSIEIMFNFKRWMVINAV